MTEHESFGSGGLERRRAERTPVPPTSPAVSVVGARLVNVTRFGMMIESPVLMEKEAVLKLRLIVAGQKADVEARVVACTAGAAGGRRTFGVGLEFTSIPPAVRDRLARTLAVPASSARTA